MSATVTQKPLVDALGNISVHGRSGVNVQLNFQDASGVAVDVSSTPLYFEIASVLRAPLVPDPTTLGRALLILSDVEIDRVGLNVPTAFVLRDESVTDASGVVIPVILWSGTFTVYGYT